MAILKLYDTVTAAIDKGEFRMGIFIDLSKSFDTLDHAILLKKLELYGIRGLPNDLLKSYLTNRKQYVTYNSFKSRLQQIH